MLFRSLEDVADNLFNPDPYYQQGGDMVRVGGLQYTLSPTAAMGARITDMRLAGKPIEADKTYKVAGWAPVAEGARDVPGAKPVWELVESWLKSGPNGTNSTNSTNTANGHIAPRRINTPTLEGVRGNPGSAAL